MTSRNMTSTLEDKRIQNVYEMIRNQYSFLQWNLYWCLCIKTLKDGKVWFWNIYIQKVYPLHPHSIKAIWDVTLEDVGWEYKIRADYASWAADKELQAWRRISVLWETAVLMSFLVIISKFMELIDLNKNGSPKFHSFIKNEVTLLNNDFDDLFWIIKLFRNVFSHSIDYDYKLEETDFSGWKKHYEGEKRRKKKPEILKVNMRIDPIYILDIQINLIDVKRGAWIQDFANIYQMLVLIEFCIISLWKYNQTL